MQREWESERALRNWNDLDNDLALRVLSEAAGILPFYYDVGGQRIDLDDESRLRMLEAMDLPAREPGEARASLQRFVREFAAQQIAVVRLREARPLLELRLPRELQNLELALELRPEDPAREASHPNANGSAAQAATRRGPEHMRLERSVPPDFSAVTTGGPASESSELKQILNQLIQLEHPGQRLERLALERAPRPGYYEARISAAGRAGTVLSLPLIVAPDTCYVDPELERQRRGGIMLQLYALRSERNLGIGDLGDIQDLAHGLKSYRPRVIGVSPLHALFPADPERRSPYSPSSRLFFNAAYLAPELVPEWRIALLTRERIEAPGFQEWLQAEKARERIDYRAVLGRKIQLLEDLFDEFYENDYAAPADSSRRADEFEAFRAREGEELRLHAIFECLDERFRNQGLYGFSNWPAEYRDPRGPVVAAYAAEHERRVLFFEYLQWIFREQLDHLCRDLAARGAGLLLDLAVGADPGGSEVWTAQRLYAKGAGAGAPPDPFSATGQNWGLACFIPHELRADRYRRFIQLIRRNMPPDGMLRIDHAAGLLRLYWAFDPAPEDQAAGRRCGGYVRQDLDALCAILALESRRLRCTVICEDLGTVPNEVRARMQTERMLGWKVVIFERLYGGAAGEHGEPEGAFLRPQFYARDSVATMNTHDLPTLPGWWTGRDLRLRRELGQLNDEALGREDWQRGEDRRRFLERCAELGLLNDGLRKRIEELDLDALDELAHSFLAHSHSKLALASLHDLLLDLRQPNLPGTVDEYPNWALRYPVSVEAIPELPAAARALRLLQHRERVEG